MEDELMEAEEQAANELIQDDLIIISHNMTRMIINEDPSPDRFTKDVDVFNKNPSVEFDAEIPFFVIVKPRTENCGKTDGCESGCWRVMARDKLVKDEDNGEILGFKKILKFCLKEKKPREYKRSWVMEEYRVTNNLNWKQDDVICKIRLLFQEEINILLAKHFKTTYESLPQNVLLPAYGYYSPDGTQDEYDAYLSTLAAFEGNEWTSYVTNNDVYRLHPLYLVNARDKMFQDYGTCVFSNETYGETDECDGGYWEILHGDILIMSTSEETIGFKKVFKFYETEKQIYVRGGEDVKVTWTIEEYRLREEVKDNEEEVKENEEEVKEKKEKVKEKKVLCVIKITVDD